MIDQSSIEGASFEEAGYAVKPNVGAQLRAAREGKGIQLNELANTLKLGARQVEALEQGNWEALPGHTFIRGFVRNYARLVQLDPAPLMAELDMVLEKPVSQLGNVESRPATMPQGGASLSRRDRAVVLSGALVVAFAGLVYFLLPNDLSALRENAQSLLDSLSRKEAPVAQPVAAPDAAAEPVFPPGSTPQQVMNPQADSPAVPAEPVAAASVPAAVVEASSSAAVEGEKPVPVVGGAPLRFVFEKESWVEVRDRNNKVILSQRGTSGVEQSVSGNGPFSLIIGFAPGVKLFWHGQAVDLLPHTRGDVARLVLE
ncbi:MAG: helix-turn-helix domain-containing protein [Rhodocyclales bacterium GT-UBC]|nr:MAG: helix-turn-helix domain-containing protein [Rhodocyclales bacterium GT-UBC]